MIRSPETNDVYALIFIQGVVLEGWCVVCYVHIGVFGRDEDKLLS